MNKLSKTDDEVSPFVLNIQIVASNMHRLTPSTCFSVAQKLRELVEKGLKGLEVAAKRIGRTAKISAQVIARSDLAHGAVAATTEAARSVFCTGARSPNYQSSTKPISSDVLPFA